MQPRFDLQPRVEIAEKAIALRMLCRSNMTTHRDQGNDNSCSQTGPDAIVKADDAWGSIAYVRKLDVAFADGDCIGDSDYGRERFPRNAVAARGAY
jgi:hypothetical protein